MQKIVKKLLAAVLSVMLVMSLIPSAVFSVLAAEDMTQYADAPLLQLDTPIDVSYDGTEISGLFKFIPENNGAYAFYSEGNSDTYAKVVDQNGNYVGYNDDCNNYDSNFYVKFFATAGRTYYLFSRLYSSYDSGEYRVEISKNQNDISDVISNVVVSDVQVVKDLNGYTKVDGDGNEYFYYDYSSPQYTLYFNDGTQPKTYTGNMYYDGEYISLEYNDNQETNHWNDIGTYEVNCTFRGVETTFNVEVIANPIERVEVEPVTVVKEMGGYFNTDYDSGEQWYYYNYSRPEYTVYYKDGTQSETNNYGKYVLNTYCELEYDDNQYENHWTTDINIVECTFAGVNCSFVVNVVDVPVSYVEIEDVVLNENIGGHFNTDYDSGEQWYYYNHSRPKYTVYFKDGTHTETDSYDKQVFNNTYSLNYSIDQYENHFEVGQSYEIPCTFMGVACSFNVIVNESPIDNVIIEDVTVIKDVNGYRTTGSDGQTYFYYSFSTPKYTVIFKDGTQSETNSNGKQIGNQYLYLSYSDDQYENHFTLGQNKVSCQFAGKDYEFNVNVIENPIDYIEFEEITVYENLGGYTTSDNGQEYYRYRYSVPNYTLHFNDGSVSETSSYGKTVNGNYYSLNYSDDQVTNHWVAGNTYDVNYTFMNMKGTFKVTVAPNPVLRVEVDSVSLIENMGGYTDTDASGTDYYRYSYGYPRYTVYFKDGTHSSKTSGSFVYNNQWYSMDYNDSQYQNHWTVNNTYQVPFTLMGFSSAFAVSIVENPVDHVEVDEISVIENAGGYVRTDSNGKEYYYYSNYSPKYTVYYKDGTHSNKMSGSVQVGDNWYSLDFSANQDEVHWEVGNTYDIPYTFMNLSSSFKVTVIENPVQNIGVEPVTVFENISGYYDTDENGEQFFRYRCSPKYTVYFKDGTKSATNSYDKQVNGRSYWISYYDEQYRNHWTVGNTYSVRCEFMGISGTFDVTVAENPVERVEVNNITIIENTDGYINTDEDDKEYFYYNYSPKYTVYFKDGTHSNTTSGSTQIGDDWYGMQYEDNQYESHWTVGNTYDVTCTFMGAESGFKATITENPVARVEVEAVSIMEKSRGYIAGYGDDVYFRYSYSPNYTVYFKDGSKAESTNGGSIKVGTKWYSLSTSDTQYEQHWTVGGTYDVSATFMGIQASGFKVTITESPVARVEIEDVTLIKESGGWTNTDEDGNSYYVYDYSPVYTVYFKDGTKSETDNDGKTVNGNEYWLQNIDDDQYENHWTVGGTYTVTCSFMGVEGSFNVTIAESPVARIEVDNAVSIADVDAWTDYDENDNKYLRYTYSTPKYTVYFKDGTKTEKNSKSKQIYGQNYWLAFEDNQEEVHWTVGGTYTVTCTFAGVKSTFNVAVKPVSDYNAVIPALTLGVPKTVSYIDTLSGLMKFTPSKDGSYVFTSVSNKYYTYCELYDENGKQLDSAFGDEDRNFRLEAELKAGKVYYVFAGPEGMEFAFGDNETGNIQFDVRVDELEDTVCRHTGTEVRNAKTATCTTDGYTGDIFCKKCGEKISEGRVIPATGHTEGEWKVVTKPTLTENGSRQKVCTKCGAVLATEEIPALEVTYDTVNATVNEVENVSVAPSAESNLPDTTEVIVVKEENTGKQVKYEIHLENEGDVIQPEAPVLVKLPIPDGFNKDKVSVYRTEADGSKTRMDIIVEGDYIYFVTEHFSLYEILEKLCGDINDDGKVNNKDLTRLFQYLSDWDVAVNESALDVNGDGKTNNKDLTRLFQFLSDWDVEIF